MRAWGSKYARGVRRTPGEMNKLEAQYAQSLELMCRAGEISWYQFDAVKLRLADKTFYTPDFFVLRMDSTLEVHEVKGHWEDDARVKIKVAASLFPFKFVAVKKVSGAWSYEEF
jgi:hypothetical protein